MKKLNVNLEGEINGICLELEGIINSLKEGFTSGYGWDLKQDYSTK